MTTLCSRAARNEAEVTTCLKFCMPLNVKRLMPFQLLKLSGRLPTKGTMNTKPNRTRAGNRNRPAGSRGRRGRRLLPGNSAGPNATSGGTSAAGDIAAVEAMTYGDVTRERRSRRCSSAPVVSRCRRARGRAPPRG